MTTDEKYMRRALQLARLGRGSVHTNPMVGAVIVHNGRIIGEGFHRRYGEGHAEVNAVASVSAADAALLRESTIYVTLEPCSHYGKTPPCSKLIIDKGIRRIVVGSLDPFPEVSGRGIRMLREAGREVVTGVLEKECLELNRQFMTAHTRKRPYILLKWAQSADGFIDRLRTADEQPQQFSTPLTAALVHQLRSEYNAIMVGSATVRLDNPSLTVRLWHGNNPLRVVLSRDGNLGDCRLLNDGIPTVVFTSAPAANFPETATVIPLEHPEEPLPEIVGKLYSQMKINSLMVEGGSRLLTEFIKAGLWDEIRVEQTPILQKEGIAAPSVPLPDSVETIDGNTIFHIKSR